MKARTGGRAAAARVIRRLRSADRSPPALPTRDGPTSPLQTYEPEIQAAVAAALPYTMTSAERVVATADAVAYVTRRGLAGALVECGVWRGGSVLAMIKVLQQLGVDDRDIFLFDTFEGMTKPTEADTSVYDPPALETWESSAGAGQVAWDWAFSDRVFNLEEVRKRILMSGYPKERLHFIKGAVEDTLPAKAPVEIAVLRLDTDWYESTRHELTHLYPRLALGGVLIIDDYGHWKGAQRAVDEYFSETAQPLLLSRIDYTGRIGVKH